MLSQHETVKRWRKRKCRVSMRRYSVGERKKLSQHDNITYLCTYPDNKQENKNRRVSMMICLFVYINVQQARE
jgi:hypothetical protein